MTDPNRSSPTVVAGWESLRQRSTTFVVIGLLSLSTLLTPGGRERLSAWSAMAMGTLTPPPPVTSIYSNQPTELTVEQRRVARWIANRYRVSVSGVEKLVRMGFEVAGNQRLDPFLLLAVIAIESGFNPLAESPVGAVGLMQVMPKVHADKFRAHGGEKEALDPRVNMLVGAQILREYIDRFGSEMEALRAYVGAIQQPTEYPSRVFSIRERMVAASVGRALA